MCNSSCVENNVDRVSLMLAVSLQEKPWHHCWRALKSLLEGSEITAFVCNARQEANRNRGGAVRNGPRCPFTVT